MSEFWSNPLFGLFLSIFCFVLGTRLHSIFKTPIANPLLIALVLCYGFLKVFRISIDDYMVGADIISAFLVPVTAILGLSIYRQREILKKDFLPITAGCLAGSLLSIGSSLILCKMFKLDEVLTASLVPKTVTTVIAIDISEQLGGMQAITILAVMVCGTVGALLHPILLKALKLNNKVAAGVAIGSSSHALGTTSALRMGEVEGAISGVSIGITGILMVIIALFV